MRRSRILAKLRAGKFARVAALGHFLPFFVHYAAQNGYDGIWFDLEHRTMPDHEVQHIIHLCYYNDLDCMVRPPSTERTRLYRYLEEGAAGLLMPLVSTADAARQIVNVAKFPPLGNRGFDGSGLDARFGTDSWAPNSTFTHDANRETFIAAQIETPEGLDNAEEIAAVPGIDMLFLGPADLGLRMAVRAAGEKVDTEEATRRVAAAAQKHGKWWTRVVGSVEDLDRFVGMGACLVPWGGEYAAVMNVLKSSSKDLDAVLARHNK